MLKITLDLLAHRIKPYVACNRDGKPVVRASNIDVADRELLKRNWHAVMLRLFPHAYFNGQPISEEQIEQCLTNSGDLSSYHSGRLTRIDALRATRSWLTQCAQLHDAMWSGRRQFL